MKVITSLAKTATCIYIGFEATKFIAPVVPQLAPVYVDTAKQLMQAQNDDQKHAILENTANITKGRTIDVAIQQLNSMRQ
ncbi:hypothetical protein [Paraburkholderia fungorum]|jgi:hypothetical protein|uniref:hypothetical protein n=1 Tax=Paraburkholderia fungorum TaxID=134537 RepID=UPI000D0499C6|nr:hypothetical protein [Paraburkholderia fungorum]PRZ45329.1 hypothetical protein BX589_1398 [Paraburkholderia fungorum]